MSDGRQYCTFFLDSLFFGVEVLAVQEITRFQEMTQVPLAPPVVEGLINLRGQIVTAIDLRRRLKLPERADDTLPMNVIVRTDDSIVSLLVDTIGDVLEVDEGDFEPPPEMIDPTVRELIRGVYKLEARLLLVIDTEKTIDLDIAAVLDQV